MSRRSLVLVAGIPGAGKSTMLARRPVLAPGAVVLDSDPVRSWLRDRLPAGTAYRRYRPLVHLWHRLRLVVALCCAWGPVVVHLPATAASTRVLLATAALLTARSRYLVWVDAEPGEARIGQRDRGRVLARGGFARHSRRGQRFATALRAGHRPAGWSSVRVVDRARAPRGLVLRVVAARPRWLAPRIPRRRPARHDRRLLRVGRDRPGVLLRIGPSPRGGLPRVVRVRHWRPLRVGRGRRGVVVHLGPAPAGRLPRVVGVGVHPGGTRVPEVAGHPGRRVRGVPRARGGRVPGLSRSRGGMVPDVPRARSRRLPGAGRVRAERVPPAE